MKKFSKQFVKDVKAEYPNRISLHDALAREETSVEWHLRQGAQFHMTAKEVVDCFKKFRFDKIYRTAQTCLRREALLEQYLKLMASHQTSVIQPAKQSSKKAHS